MRLRHAHDVVTEEFDLYLFLFLRGVSPVTFFGRSRRTYLTKRGSLGLVLCFMDAQLLGQDAWYPKGVGSGTPRDGPTGDAQGPSVTRGCTTRTVRPSQCQPVSRLLCSP